MLRLLVYPNQYTSFSEAEAHELPWADFKNLVLKDALVVPNKGSEPQYFPGSMREGAESKGDASVDRVYLYCLDADDITPREYEKVIETIVADGLECVVHSTYSHLAQIKKNGNYRVRFIFTLSRPVLADEWRIFWSNCRLTFHSLADGTTAAPSKHYLVPSLPPGEEARAAKIYKEFSGKPIDVDEMMTRFGLKKLADAEVESFDIGKERITGSMFQEMVSRKRKGDDVKIANALKSGLAKNAYAESGAREATLFAIAGMLAHEFPRGNPDDLCEPLRYSVEFEEKRGGPKFVEFRDKVVRRQRDLLQRAAVKRMEAAKEAARVAQIKDTVEEFTEESLEPYIRSCGNKFKFKDLKDRLVLVHRNGYYVFDGTGYMYATNTSLLATIRKCLRFRAENHLDFDYFFPTEGGKPPVPKTADAFVKDHGDVIKQVRYNYEGTSWYDPEACVLSLSNVKSPSRLVPERIPEVEEYMRIACPDDKMRKRWEQWMAQYASTDRALVGLVLTGPTGVGKSAFAAGMAKMHGDAPPGSMANYLSNHPTQLLENPLVFADESLPEIQGRVPTDRLRTLISSATHEVNPKGQPIVVLDGFVRTIMAFQNLKKFDFGRGHTREDIEAIEKRFLFLVLAAAAAAAFNYDLFVTNNGLAKHALYLAETMKRSSDRFGVDTSGSDHVVFGDPVAMVVADWIIEYLLQKAATSVDAKMAHKRVPVFVNKERVFVNVTLVRKTWANVSAVSTKFVPTQQQIAEAVRTLAVHDSSVRIRMGTGQESFWEIKTNVLKSRAIALDIVPAQHFDLLLKIPHELGFLTSSFVLTKEEKLNRTEALKIVIGNRESAS